MVIKVLAMLILTGALTALIIIALFHCDDDRD